MAERSDVSSSEALIIGHRPDTPKVEFSVSPVKGFRLPGSDSL